MNGSAVVQLLDGDLAVHSGNITVQYDGVNPFTTSLPNVGGGSFDTSNFLVKLPLFIRVSNAYNIVGSISGVVPDPNSTQTDLVATGIKNSTGPDEYTFDVNVTGQFMHSPTALTPVTDMHLYWSSDETVSGQISEIPGLDAFGVYWNSGHIQYIASNLGIPPPGANYLVFVVDPTNRIAEADETNNVVAIPVVHAPVLDPTKSPVLSAIDEDAATPVGAVGTLVSSLVAFATPAGQIDNVTDEDVGALLGIAVTAADTSNGTWFYSIDAGATWADLGAVTDTSARLLAADANTRLYFQPNAKQN